jgi:hypothetical protein
MMQSIPFDLSQEELFLLSICRTVSTDTSIKATEDFLNKNLNWDLVGSMASQHGIAGLLYVALSRCSNTGNVPDYLLEKLETTYRQNAFRNLLYSKEFNEIVLNFNNANIRTIPLKGIEFLHSIYAHNIGLRRLSDIDILVEKENVPRAEKILLDIGCERKKTSFRNSRRNFHAIFLHNRGMQPIVIELHWDVDFSDSPFNINIEEFWERSQEITSGKFNCHGFSIEDNIIFNCFHIVREVKKGPDEFFALKHFCDIAKIITQAGNKINWDCIIKRTQEYNVIRPVFFILVLIKELFDIKELPQTIVDTIHKVGYQDIFGCYAVKEYIFPPQNNEKKMLPFWVVDFADHKTFRGKVRAFIELPRIILNLYDAHDDTNQSAFKSVLSLSYYYTKKIIKTAALYIFTPQKAIMLHKKMTLTNQKTGEVIEWIRG